MKNVLLIMVLFGSVTLSASETYAQCACMDDRINMSPQKEFELAHAVFVGKVVAIKEFPRDKDNRGTESVTFQVSKAWKRDLDWLCTISREYHPRQWVDCYLPPTKRMSKNFKIPPTAVGG